MSIRLAVSTVVSVVATASVGAALAAGLATPAAAAVDEPVCTTAPHVIGEPVHLAYQNLWTYTYSITWCVENDRIVWVSPAVTPRVLTEKCTWAGSMEESSSPAADRRSWTLFNMSEFRCEKEDGAGAHGVTPWAVVTVYADGHHEVVGADIEE